MEEPQLDKANVAGVPSYPPKQMRIWALTVASLMSVLAFLAIALRLLSRRIRAQPLWWDDYMIMFSMVSCPRLHSWIVLLGLQCLGSQQSGYKQALGHMKNNI